ncbi:MULTISPECIES: hypothetical protein [unclassified Bradyrhizobium]|uniref:hypothetical protein n=1 Tax=unclassified Bradyrhizobium TaxID=2631580 RepID=UPI0028EB10EE|nr:MULTISPECIES: hypothetical protein [unclassified Bradyrhizobium]
MASRPNKIPFEPEALELPPPVARAFTRDMHAYLAEADPIKRDQIAVLQMHSLQEHYRGKLRLDDVSDDYSSGCAARSAHEIIYFVRGWGYRGTSY